MRRKSEMQKLGFLVASDVKGHMRADFAVKQSF